MRVIFDYQIFHLQRYGGISRYFIELARELNKLPGCTSRIAAPFHSNSYLEDNYHEEFVIGLNPLAKKILYNRFIDRRVKTNEGIAKYFCSGKSTILHETYYTDRFEVKSKKVITIHDMIYELFNNGLEGEKYVMEMKKKAIQEADAIIAVSHNTKNDLLKFFPEAKDKTFVVHHGVTPFAAESTPDYKHRRPYLLYVGNRGWYKNFSRLLTVFGNEKAIHENVDLIAFGGGAPDENEKQLIEKLDIKENVFFVKGNDDLLNSLYKSAEVLVYNSKYEGFGMPVLEAMQLGCPVICSNSSSLPEVAGSAAIMIDPDSDEELRDAILKIAGRADVKNAYRDACLIRASEFSWKKCALETKQVYNRLLNE